MIDKKIFAERLKIALMNRGMQQEDLARALKIDPGTVSNYAHAVNAPRYDRLKRMAEILEVSQGWLTGAVDQIDPPKTLRFVGKGPDIGIDESLIYRIIRKRQKETFLMLGVPEHDAERLADLSIDLKDLTGSGQISAVRDFAKKIVEDSQNSDNGEPIR